MEFNLNGKKIILKNNMSVEEFLKKQGFDLEKIAVEKDGEILPKSRWQNTMIGSAQSYEVVEFVGGG